MIEFTIINILYCIVGFVVSARLMAMFIDLVIYFSPILRCHYKYKYAKRHGNLTNVSIKKNGN